MKKTIQYFQYLRKGTKWITTILALLILLVLVVLFTYWREFSSIKQTYQEKLIHNSEDMTGREKFVLVANSIIKKSDLSILYPYLEIPREFKDWWEEQEKIGQFKKLSSDRFKVQESIEFEFSRVNDCPLPHCYQWRIPFFDIPSHLWRGLMGIEDERFLNHKGVDAISLLRALLVDIKEMRLAQGGSTITQQLVRHLFLTNEKSFLRKFKEILFSLFLESDLSKDEILQIYFNEVFWGSVGGVKIEGINAASIIYFNKKPKDLTSYEASMLVSMLKGPNFYSFRSPERLKARSELVFKKLKEMMLVNSKDLPWSDVEWKDWTKLLNKKSNETSWKVVIEIMRLSKSHLNFFEEFQLAKGGELILQEMKSKPLLQKKDLSFKILVEDLSCVYGQGQKTLMPNSCGKPFFYYSKVERDWSKSQLEEKHQVGSLLKPILYRIFVKNGKNFDDLVSQEEFSLKLISGQWTPKESKKDQALGEITLKEALQKSRNIPVIRLADEMGFKKLEGELTTFIPTLQLPLAQYPAQLLGSIELTLPQVIEGYEKFIHEECDDLLQEKINDKTSVIQALMDHKNTTIGQVISEEASQWSFFGKTGTSNNGNDNWFTWFDGKYLGTIWFGNESKESDYSLTLSGAWSSYKILENLLLNGGKAKKSLDCEVFRPTFQEVAPPATFTPSQEESL